MALHQAGPVGRIEAVLPSQPSRRRGELCRGARFIDTAPRGAVSKNRPPQ
ncbi:hypothetical protein [Streptomyces sp. NPDC050856]